MGGRKITGQTGINSGINFRSTGVTGRHRYPPLHHDRRTPDAPAPTSHTRPPMSARYLIRVHGQLDGRWARCFHGLELQPGPEGTTLLVGPVADQSALHGHLRRIHELGLPLVELRREGPVSAAPRTLDPREAR